MSQTDDSAPNLGDVENKPKLKSAMRERRYGSANRIRKPFVKAANFQTAPLPFMQPAMSKALFYDPCEKTIWDGKPVWSPEECFCNNEDASKALLDDFRQSIAAAQNATFPPRDFSSVDLDELRGLRPTKPAAKRMTYEQYWPRERKTSVESQGSPIKVLKRPAKAALQPELFVDKETENVEKEVDFVLERFCLSSDFSYFDKAMDICRRSIVNTYYGVLELSHRNLKEGIPDIRSALLIKVANGLEKHYQSKEAKMKRAQKKAESSKCIQGAGELNGSTNTHQMNGHSTTLSAEDVVEKLKTLAVQQPPSAAPKDDRKEWDPIGVAYEKFVLMVRQLHLEFIAKLAEALGGLDPNVFVERDQSSDRMELLDVCKFPRIPEEKAARWKELNAFLYNEFRTVAYVERIAFKTFKLDLPLESHPLAVYEVGARVHAASLQFVRAALVRTSKGSPFEGLSSVCADRTHLTRNLHLLCCFMRDPTKPCTPSFEMRNLTKLYTQFYHIFCLIYDAVFNKGYKHGNPWRSARQQRWLFPEGIRDPLYNEDPAIRLHNNLPQFVDEKHLAFFKFFFYWSGIRLFTFLGYKIVEKIDLDFFDEQVQVALCGLTVGFHVGMADNVHLLQLARFVIAIATICEQDTKDAGKKSFHTACRLLVEYLAVLLRQFNRFCAEKSLRLILVENGLDNQIFAFLLPIVVLTFWMAQSPIFFEYEAWTRRWAPNVSFLADLWPEMSALANNLRGLQQHGVFKGLSISHDETRGKLLPEIVNSYGISPVFDALFTICPTDSTTNKGIPADVSYRLFVVWENVRSLANHGSFFTFDEKEGFAGHSDERRVLVRDHEYIDMPRLLPVPLDEIERCINSRKKELESEQAKELADLISRAKADSEKDENVSSKVLVIVEPRYLVIDTNSFIDGLDTILHLMEEPGFKILVPSAVISELKGLRNRSMSPNDADEENSKKVAQEAVRSLRALENTKRSNCLLLLCSGETMPMDVSYYDVYEGKGKKPNNDRLIIECARKFSENVCARSIRIPRGDTWIFRNVLLVTRDQVMMLLANAYRLPSLDIDMMECKMLVDSSAERVLEESISCNGRLDHDYANRSNAPLGSP